MFCFFIISTMLQFFARLKKADFKQLDASSVGAKPPATVKTIESPLRLLGRLLPPKESK